jgi:DNA-binding NtrC family response regulator
MEATAMFEQMVERAEEAEGQNAAAAGKLLAAGETILFVEDEAFVREVTGEVLRSAGYQVLTAKDAAEATGVYDERSAEVELLITDLVLPGENGRALAGRLQGKNPELNVLLITGYGEQMGLPGWNEEECLAKPFSQEMLLQRVRKVLDRPGRGSEPKN